MASNALLTIRVRFEPNFLLNFGSMVSWRRTRKMETAISTTPMFPEVSSENEREIVDL